MKKNVDIFWRTKDLDSIQVNKSCWNFPHSIHPCKQHDNKSSRTRIVFPKRQLGSIRMSSFIWVILDRKMALNVTHESYPIAPSFPLSVLLFPLSFVRGIDLDLTSVIHNVLLEKVVYMRVYWKLLCEVLMGDTSIESGSVKLKTCKFIVTYSLENGQRNILIMAPTWWNYASTLSEVRSKLEHIPCE